VNHRISKQLVAKAKDTGRGIALEELGGIRDRVTVRKSQRATLYSWSFAQQRAFIEYKARLVGVAVVVVDPRNIIPLWGTSRTCPSCGCVDKNRPSQSRFSCVTCGFPLKGPTVGLGWRITSRRAILLVGALSAARTRRGFSPSCKLSALAESR
jgi:IS605 OrfB family transposase